MKSLERQIKENSILIALLGVILTFIMLNASCGSVKASSGYGVEVSGVAGNHRCFVVFYEDKPVGGNCVKD
jgi:hypothetical protein